MKPCKTKLRNKVVIQLLQVSAMSLVIIILLAGCLNSPKIDEGITFVASRGSSPSAQSVDWSPSNEDKLLVTGYETPQEPAEVYIIDIKTGQKNILAHQQPAFFFEAQWAADSKHVLILAENNTKGFEPSGWWIMDIDNRLSDYFMKSSDIAWAPDGKTLAALRSVKEGLDVMQINLLLVDASTKAEDLISTSSEVDSGLGISWSSDGKYVVFSLGYQGASDLYVLNVKTRQVVRITENDGSEYPTWSPTGNIIAYVRNFPENTAKTYLYLTNSNGKCEVAIPNLENVWSPTWSPDGKKLGYISRDGIYFLDIEKVLGRDIYQNLCP